MELEVLPKDPLTGKIIQLAIEVHRYLGPGLLESGYEECLCHEFDLNGLTYERQVRLPLVYKGKQLDCGYVLDLIVQREVIVELKSVERLLGIHEAHLMTYMRLSGIHKGLLLNFNVTLLRDGIKRLVL